MNIWRERINRWLHPLAANVPLSPNSVTVIACAMNIVAALLFANVTRSLAFYPVAIVTLGVAALLDALDGAVARAQNKTSRFGDFLDHFLDRVSDSSLVAGWAWGMSVRPLLILISVAGVLLVGYLGTQIEATFGVRSYEGTGRAEFIIGIVVFALAGYLIQSLQWSVRLLDFSIAELLTLLLIAVLAITVLQRLAQARRLAVESERRA